MKSVVSLLAVISLVGPGAFAQKKGESRAESPRTESSRAESPRTQSYPKSQPSQREDRGSSSGYGGYNKQPKAQPDYSQYKQPKAEEKPAAQPANDYRQPKADSRADSSNRPTTANNDYRQPRAEEKPAAQPANDYRQPKTDPRTDSGNRQPARPAYNQQPTRQQRPTETAVQRQQREESQSEQTRSNLNPNVQAKVAKNATVSQTEAQKRSGTFTERNKETNTTFVRNAQTGKVIAKYDNKNGVNTFNSPGVKIQQQKDPSGHVISETKTYSGATRATNYQRDQSGRVTQYTRTTTINNVNIYESNRTYVRISSNYGYGYYDVYRPTWWGSPSGWGYQYGSYRYPVYTGFYVGWNGRAAYWGPAGMIAFGGPGYSCGWSGCWSNYFGVGYGWWSYSPYGYPYYASYVFPAWYQPVYPSLSWWLADYVLSTAVETDYLYRQAAATQHAEFEIAKSDAINQIQGDRTNDSGYGLTHQIRQIIAHQVEELVSLIQKKNDGTMSEDDANQELDATNMADKGHLFTANNPVYTSTVIDDDGNTAPCTLQAGDLIGEVYSTDPSTGQIVRQDPVAVDTDVTEDNPSGQKYVATMYVKASKYGSCAPNQIVTVDVSALQDMVNDELASVEKGMGEAVARHIGF